MGALINNNYKLVATSIKENKFELYDLKDDPAESQDLTTEKPIVFEQMKKAYLNLNASIDSSVAGKDYPEGKVLKNPKSHFWMKDDRYEPFFEEWLERPEYRKRILRGR